MLGRFSVLCAFALVSVAPTISGSAAAQAPNAVAPSRQSYRERLLGVYDELSGDPVEGVRVQDIVSGMSSLTTTTGTVALVFLPDGGGLVRLQKVGYQPTTFMVPINPSDTVPLTVTLQRLTTLPGVVSKGAATKYLSPSLRGFEERRQGGMGYFISDSVLRASENQSIGSIISTHVPSLLVMSGGRRTQVYSNRAMVNGHPCAVDVYVDGILTFSSATPDGPGETALGDTATARMIRGTAPRAPTPAAMIARQTAMDLSQYLVSDLAGIEFHNTADMPIEAAHTSGGCGALFLWTKER